MQDTKLARSVAWILLTISAVLSAIAPARVWAQDASPVAPAQPAGISSPSSLALPRVNSIQLIDQPSDDGRAFLLLFELAGGDEQTRVNAEVLIITDGKEEWRACQYRPLRFDSLATVADSPEFFGWSAGRPGAVQQYPPEARILTVDRYIIPDGKGEFEPAELVTGQEYTVRLVVRQGDAEQRFAAGAATLREALFHMAKMNNLIFCVVFAIIIMVFIFAARRNPNLFIRRIQGLEAVDEAIGRATEMGKPVLHINGLDPLSTLATLAAVNILGRIARARGQLRQHAACAVLRPGGDDGQPGSGAQRLSGSRAARRLPRGQHLLPHRPAVQLYGLAPAASWCARSRRRSSCWAITTPKR